MDSNLNYFNFKKFKDRYLITNDLGKYLFLSEKEFSKLCDNTYMEDEELCRKLSERYFVIDKNREAFIDEASLKLREHKSYLFEGTQLHIFVLTTNCNQSCVYCQASAKVSGNSKKLMSMEIAEKSVDIALQSPAQNLSFEFQGGEPLLNFKVLKHIVKYASEKNQKFHKQISFNLVSNLTLLNDEMLKFFIENNVSISASLDGDEYLHNKNRPYVCESSYEIVKNQINKINNLYKKQNKKLKVQAIETTTRFSLNRWKEIIDTYVTLGMNNIFIRPLTPLGRAKEQWKNIGYTAEEFLEFYKKCCNYIKTLNAEGVDIKEGHNTIFLSKILDGENINYMELRSPCGGTIGQLAYNYDGDIYTCDEGRMLAERGDNSFKLGNVYKNDFNSLINNNVCSALCSASCIETLPGCSECVYSPYCGVCPVYNYDKTGSLFDQIPGNYKCKIYKGMLDWVFENIMNN